MTDPQQEIRLIASRWKNYDPRLYERFMKVLDAYAFDVTVTVTEASSDRILQAQGHAQMARKFVMLFAETLDEPVTRATPPGPTP